MAMASEEDDGFVEPSLKRTASFQAKRSIIAEEVKAYPPELREMFSGISIEEGESNHSEGIYSEFPFSAACLMMEKTMMNMRRTINTLQETVREEKDKRIELEDKIVKIVETCTGFAEKMTENERRGEELTRSVQELKTKTERTINEKIASVSENIQRINDVSQQKNSEMEENIQTLRKELEKGKELGKKENEAAGTQRNVLRQTLERLQMDTIEYTRNQNNLKERLDDIEHIHTDFADTQEKTKQKQEKDRAELLETVAELKRLLEANRSALEERLTISDDRLSKTCESIRSEIVDTKEVLTKRSDTQLANLRRERKERREIVDALVLKLESSQAETMRSIGTAHETLSSHADRLDRRRDAVDKCRRDLDKCLSESKARQEAMTAALDAHGARFEGELSNRDRTINELTEKMQTASGNLVNNVEQIKSLSSSYESSISDLREAQRCLSKELGERIQSITVSSQEDASRLREALESRISTLRSRVDNEASKLNDQHELHSKVVDELRTIMESLFTKEQNAREHLEGRIEQLDKCTNERFAKNKTAREQSKREVLDIMRANSERDRNVLLDRMAGELKEKEEVRKQLLTTIASKHSELEKKLSVEERRRERLANQLNDRKFEWTPDQMTNECMVCSATFSFFRRKHHCRQCGQLICNNCSKWRKYDSPGGAANVQRICTGCASSKTMPPTSPDGFITPEALKRAESEAARQVKELREATAKKGTSTPPAAAEDSATAPTPYVARALDPF